MVNRRVNIRQKPNDCINKDGDSFSKAKSLTVPEAPADSKYETVKLT